VPYGEADVVVTLLTEQLGKISAIARSARKSARRFAAALEPIHTISVALEERPGDELLSLREAVVGRARAHLLGDLERLYAAGQVLRWVREGWAPRTPEPAVWVELESLLDRLDDPNDPLPASTHLAASGLRLLRHLGYGLELDSCVRCGRRCEPGRSAFVDATSGGLLCQACGGGQSPSHHLIDAAARRRLWAAASGRDAALEPQDTGMAKQLVDEALVAHAGVRA
jgi:DNA repair protein RecO (recombination protein O)